jgi:hypothetical protein
MHKSIAKGYFYLIVVPQGAIVPSYYHDDVVQKPVVFFNILSFE